MAAPQSSGTFGPRQYNFEELAKAAHNFSDDYLLGGGGFGQVYQGFLHGQTFAIKKLSYLPDQQKKKNLEHEINVISSISHRNLVKLVGYCFEGRNALLVLEYFRNKSLKVSLHEKKILDWPKRMKIAIGSAKGLEYLHENCEPRIIHQDIKPDNILLDENFEPKIADFGLAESFPDAVSHLSISTKGTKDYIDPEHSGKLSDKSDVYSFGVVLLELITGRKSTHEDIHIVGWAKPRIIQALKGEYMNFVDSNLQKYNRREMQRMIFCAASCVYKPLFFRPTIKKIVRALEEDKWDIPLKDIWNDNDYNFLANPEEISPAATAGSNLFGLFNWRRKANRQPGGVKKEERAIPTQATGDGTEEETKNVIMPRQLPNQQWTTATNYDFSNNNIGSSLVHIPQMVYADVALVSGAGISHNRKFCYGYATSPGKGSSMEDFYETRIDSVDGEIVGLFGVFDGHGGARAAEYVKQNLFSNLIRHPKFISDTKSAIADAYNHTDSEFLKSENNQNSESGSTASTAILIGDRLLVANVGDSRAVTCRGGNAIAASRDHKPDRSDERQRIEDAGGFVTWAGTWKVGGVLAVSRAFGDRLLKQYVVADPEIQDEKIDSSLEFLILASYGLWAVVNNKEAVVMTKPIEDPELAAKSLLQEAYQRGSAYNITCIVVRFLANQGTPTTHDSRMI